MDKIFLKHSFIMAKDIKERLSEAMQQRGIKIPKLSEITGIPKDRIYKWFQQGSYPKAEDATVLEKWINNPKYIKDSLSFNVSISDLVSSFIKMEAMIDVLMSVNAEILAAHKHSPVATVQKQLEAAYKTKLKELQREYEERK